MGTVYSIGSGYTPPSIATIESLNSTSYVEKKVWHPPTLAQPGQPAIPPTPEIIKKIKNEGWNTSARSLGQLSDGGYFLFNVMDGVSGAFLGIGPDGRDGSGISNFSHAIICDRGGVHIHEGETLVKELKNRQLPITMLRIYRQEGGKIVYVATTGAETLVYTSSTKYPSLYPAYVYGVLYSSGDTVLSAALKSGIVLYGAV